MFKKSFSLALLLSISFSVFAEDVRELRNVLETRNIGSKYNIKFNFIHSPELEKLVKLLSPESKLELEVFVNKGKGLIFDNPELLEFIEKYNNLYMKFKSCFGREPIVTLVLSVNGEREFDLVKEPIDFEKFKSYLSAEELKQFDIGISEFQTIMFSKASAMFGDLEKSDLNKELKAKSGNKEFKASCIIS